MQKKYLSISGQIISWNSLRVKHFILIHIYCMGDPNRIVHMRYLLRRATLHRLEKKKKKNKREKEILCVIIDSIPPRWIHTNHLAKWFTFLSATAKYLQYTSPCIQTEYSQCRRRVSTGCGVEARNTEEKKTNIPKKRLKYIYFYTFHFAVPIFQDSKSIVTVFFLGKRPKVY